MTKPTHANNSKGQPEKINWPKGKIVTNQSGVFLLQERKNHFHVVYGLEINGPFNYLAAAESLGLCLMHQAGCEGKIEN